MFEVGTRVGQSLQRVRQVIRRREEVRVGAEHCFHHRHILAIVLRLNANTHANGRLGGDSEAPARATSTFPHIQMGPHKT